MINHFELFFAAAAWCGWMAFALMWRYAFGLEDTIARLQKTNKRRSHKIRFLNAYARWMEGCSAELYAERERLSDELRECDALCNQLAGRVADMEISRGDAASGLDFFFDADAQRRLSQEPQSLN